MIKIGSHVSFAAPDYFLGSVRETLSYEANAMMVYTGPPQNNRRTPVEKLKINEAHQLMEEAGIEKDDVIVHAPYLINLANTLKEDTFTFSEELLASEYERTKALKARYMVLHPGSHLKEGAEKGIASIIRGLNEVLKGREGVIVCLETMAGKGSEVGSRFEEIAQIIEGCACKEKLGVCLDTCHIHDAGYDLNDADAVLEEFDKVIGLDKLKVIHLNDSLNACGSHKDRHANLGYGQIGFENLLRIAYHPALQTMVKILETPYVNHQAPYGKEIASIRKRQWDSALKD